jgi:anthranilate synthase component II
LQRRQSAGRLAGVLLLIDNYDSFTFNLAHYFMELGQDVRVVRNDAATLDELRALAPSRVCISPGPGRPAESGLTPALFDAFAGTPIFGVCLGMQAMAEHFGGRLIHAPVIMHGKTSAVTHQGRGVFESLPSPLIVTRYHSLCVKTAPECLDVTARSDDDVIMGLRHKQLPIEGVQFHPEAILTQHGHALLSNWLRQSERSDEGP